MINPFIKSILANASIKNISAGKKAKENKMESTNVFLFILKSFKNSNKKNTLMSIKLFNEKKIEVEIMANA